MAQTGWFWLDPAISLAIGAVIVWGTWGLLRQSFNLAMDAAPDDVDVRLVEAYLLGVPGITAVHDLHVWAMSTTETALTVHLVKPDARIDDVLQEQVCSELHQRFGIAHTTIQLESGDRDCGQAPASVV
jgi:cobalt-zinc-cadmium efflux system protein